MLPKNWEVRFTHAVAYFMDNAMLHIGNIPSLLMLIPSYESE